MDDGWGLQISTQGRLTVPREGKPVAYGGQWSVSVSLSVSLPELLPRAAFIHPKAGTRRASHYSSWEDVQRANDNGSTLTMVTSTPDGQSHVGASPHTGHNSK